MGKDHETIGHGMNVVHVMADQDDCETPVAGFFDGSQNLCRLLERQSRRRLIEDQQL
jgi:hypothetical protein